MTDPNLSIHWHRSTTELPDEAWDACFPPPLEGGWWYRALERAGLDGQFRFAYASLRRGERIVGIVPVFAMDVPLRIVAPDALWPVLRVAGRLYPPLLVQPTLFVGSPCSEQGAVGLVEGTTLEAVLPALQAALDARAREVGARMLVWKDVAEPEARTLRANPAASGCFEVPSFPGTDLVLAPGGFDAYLAALPSRHRHALNKKLRASRDALAVTAVDVRDPDDATIGEIHRLYRMNLERARVRFETLTPAFFREIAKAREARFVLLVDDATGRSVAFMLYFMTGRHAINKFMGIDLDSHPRAYLYFRLWQAFIERASAEGAATVSSGQTAYRAKLDLGHALVPLSNFSKHFSPLLHRVYATVGRRVTLATLDPDLAAFLQSRRARRAATP
ncbi:MAG TPA: GNAT family N-acetyltransferase [Caldimonas sp.]|nr:GNAT family N-acetyltransferase [Caldimonas sp.]